MRNLAMLTLSLLLTTSPVLAHGAGSGGPVHVQGYTKANGTTVGAYNRREPGEGQGGSLLLPSPNTSFSAPLPSTPSATSDDPQPLPTSELGKIRFPRPQISRDGLSGVNGEAMNGSQYRVASFTVRATFRKGKAIVAIRDIPLQPQVGGPYAPIAPGRSDRVIGATAALATFDSYTLVVTSAQGYAPINLANQKAVLVEELAGQGLKLNAEHFTTAQLEEILRATTTTAPRSR